MSSQGQNWRGTCQVLLIILWFCNLGSWETWLTLTGWRLVSVMETSATGMQSLSTHPILHNHSHIAQLLFVVKICHSWELLFYIMYTLSRGAVLLCHTRDSTVLVLHLSIQVICPVAFPNFVSLKSSVGLEIIRRFVVNMWEKIVHSF